MGSKHQTARRRGALAASLTLVAMVTGPLTSLRSAAHEQPPEVTTIIQAVEPPVDGLVVQIAMSVATQLVLDNETGAVVTVLDDDGRGFIRLDGARIEANLDVPSWYLSADPFGAVAVPAEAADDQHVDRWVVVGAGSSWGWFDHRLHPGPLPIGSVRPGQILDRFSIPLDVDGAGVVIEGAVEFRPPEGRYVTDVVTRSAHLDVTVVEGPTPALLGRLHDGSDTAVVAGEAGEPMLRFGPDEVEANVASPTWQQVARSTTGLAVPDVVADAAAPPTWSVVTTGSLLTWIDPRTRYPSQPPDDPSLPATVSHWELPVTAGGRDDLVAGEIRWLPSTAADTPETSGLATRTGRLIAAGVFGVIMALVAWAGAVHNRRRSGDADESSAR